MLILREVLQYSAAEVAQILDTTPAAVNSALQRARKGPPGGVQREKRPMATPPRLVPLLDQFDFSRKRLADRLAGPDVDSGSV